MTSSLHRTAAARTSFIRWTVIVTVAASAGFLAPAVVGVLAIDLPRFAAMAALLAAGAVEGAVLGWAQAVVLRRTLPGLRVSRWAALTSAAAVVAYGVALAIADAAVTSGWAVAAVAVPGSVLILVSLGSAQWLELRHHLEHAAHWIVVTAIAWMTALAAFLAVTTPLWHEGQRASVAIVVGAVGGVLMALVQAVGTGMWLFRAGAPRPRVARGGPAVLTLADGPVGRHAAAGRS